jgi:dihydrofolate reductase
VSRPIVSLIAAVARNGAIGAGNALPWRIPSDLKRFKALTMGKPIIMGRKTFESIGKPLPGRQTIVMTREAGWTWPGVGVARDLEAALRLAGGAGEVMIGGGGEIYAAAIGTADRLYVTEVDLEPEGDVRFPRIDPEAWREVSREIGARGERDEAGFAFVEYGRTARESK